MTPWDSNNMSPRAVERSGMGGGADSSPIDRRERGCDSHLPGSRVRQGAAPLLCILGCEVTDGTQVEEAIERCSDYLGGCHVQLYVMAAAHFPFWIYCEPQAIDYLNRDFLESIDNLRNRLALENKGVSLDGLECVDGSLSEAVVKAAREHEAHLLLLVPQERRVRFRQSLEGRVRRNVAIPVVRLDESARSGQGGDRAGLVGQHAAGDATVEST